jgi:DnaJ-class molecular chaperone
MATIEQLLQRATWELGCQTCRNNPRGYMGDECPECHGEHRNAHTIELLTVLTRGAVMRPQGRAIADSAKQEAA